MEKVAIIGMGISGMSTLLAYEKLNKKVELHCFDIKTSFGKGFPFREDSNDVLINVRSFQVSFDLDEPNDFVNYLKEKKSKYGEYVPRHVYGQYLFDRTNQLIEKMNVQSHFYKIEKLIYIQKTKKIQIITPNEHIIEFDRVHLCCGELPPYDFYNLNGQPNYIQTIYPVNQRFSSVTQSDSVGVIGTSLSAIDVSRYLLKNNKAKEVVLFSKDGIFPTIRGTKIKLTPKYFTLEAVNSIRHRNNGRITLDQVNELIHKELKYHNINVDQLLYTYDAGFNSILKSIIPNEELDMIQSFYLAIVEPLNASWFGFSLEDKERFNLAYQKIFQLFGAPIPQETGIILKEMFYHKRLKIVEDVIDIIKDDKTDKFNIIKQTEKTKRIGAKVDFLANATGLDTSFRSIRNNSLLSNLLNDQIVQINENGGLNVLEDSFKIISPIYGVIDNLHAHGTLISGVQLLNNDTAVIQQSARDVVNKIYTNNS